MQHATVKAIGLGSGLLSAAVFLFLYSVAAFSDPDYVFYEDYLSDLGVGPAAWAFNSAVMIAGVLMVVFSLLGLRGVLGSSCIDRASVALLSGAGALLFFIGVFTEDAGDVHLFFSLAFFLTLLIALGSLSVALYKANPLGTGGTAFTLVTFLFGVSIALSMGANPRSETLAVLAAVAWGTVMSSGLLVKEILLGPRRRAPPKSGRGQRL